MGSLDWAPCVSCEYWVRDPYIFDGVGINGFGALCPWCFDYMEEGNEPLTAWWQNRSLRAWCAITLANSDVLPLALRRETVALGIAACLVDEWQAIDEVGAWSGFKSALSQVSLACCRAASA